MHFRPLHDRVVVRRVEADQAKFGGGCACKRRRSIEERLVASKQQIPHFSPSLEVDAGPLMRIRKDREIARKVIAKLPAAMQDDPDVLAPQFG